MSKDSSRKKPRDANQLARAILDEAIGEAPAPTPEATEKNPAAVARGKLGGSKGGKARAKKLPEKRRTEIAKKAAETRWAKN